MIACADAPDVGRLSTMADKESDRPESDNLSDQVIPIDGRPHRPPRDPPWTLKSFPVADRQTFLAAAARADQNIGEWLAEAGRARLARERGEVLEVMSDKGSDPFTVAVSMAVEVARATQRPLPRSVSRAIYRRLLPRLSVADNMSDQV
jgi:hypothetical protein